MKELTEAIISLINSAPYSPRADEIEVVIRQHMQAVAMGEVTRFDPAALATALPPLVWPKGPRVRLAKRAADDLSAYMPKDAIVLYSAPFLLIDPRDDQRNIAGILARPRRIFVAYYDVEEDVVALTAISPWYAVRAVAPQCYELLMKAWKLVKDTAPCQIP